MGTDAGLPNAAVWGECCGHPLDQRHEREDLRMATSEVIARMPAGRDERIDAVLCDVGDVIILFDRAVAAGIESRHGLEPGSLLRTALKSAEGKLAMVGGIDHGQWRRATSRVLGDDAVTEWLDYHGELNHSVVAFLEALKRRRVRVVLLSNATSRLWDDLRFHGLDGLADAVFCSADMGLAKPDPDSYRYAARHGGFALDRALYIDDTPSWVNAGVELGLRGHVFSTARGLGKELLTLGLLP